MKKAYGKILSLSVLLCAALMLVGCAAAPGKGYDTASPAPESAPEPEGMQKVFGREVTIAAYGDVSQELLTGMKIQAQELGIPFALVENAQAASDADIVLAYKIKKEERSALSQPTVIIAEDAEEFMEDDIGILLDPEDAVTLSLSTLADYPGHDTPVRALGLFTGEESAAFAGYRQMEADGKLYSRGAFYGSEDILYADWLTKKLAEIPAGLLDTIYAEDAELALIAYDALKQAQRGDAVEVICCGITEDVIFAMQEEHFLMGAAAGADPYTVGALAVRMAVALLAGEDAEIYEFPIQVVFSDDVYALTKEQELSLDQIMAALNEELTFPYWGKAAEYLREYHSSLNPV